jgi:hypothetical protein
LRLVIHSWTRHFVFGVNKLLATRCTYLEGKRSGLNERLAQVIGPWPWRLKLLFCYFGGKCDSLQRRKRRDAFVVGSWTRYAFLGGLINDILSSLLREPERLTSRAYTVSRLISKVVSWPRNMVVSLNRGS